MMHDADGSREIAVVAAVVEGCYPTVFAHLVLFWLEGGARQGWLRLGRV